MRQPPTEIWVTTPHIDRPGDSYEASTPESIQTQQIGCVHCDPMSPPPKQIFFKAGDSVCKEHKEKEK